MGDAPGFMDFVKNPKLWKRALEYSKWLDSLEVPEHLSEDEIEKIVGGVRKVKTRAAASRLMRKLGKRASPAALRLLQTLKHDRADFEHALLEHLAEFPIPEAKETLLGLLENAKETASIIQALLLPGEIDFIERLVDEYGKHRHLGIMLFLGLRRFLKNPEVTELEKERLYNKLLPFVHNSFISSADAIDVLHDINPSRTEQLLMAPEALSPENPNSYVVIDKCVQYDLRPDPALVLRNIDDAMPQVEDYFYQRRIIDGVTLLIRSGHPLAKNYLAKAMEVLPKDQLEQLYDLELETQGVKDPYGTAFDLSMKNGFESLTEPQQNVIALQWLKFEVENGGFHQYFFNTAGDTFREAIRAAEAINYAPFTELLYRVRELFPPSFPDRVRDRRHEQLARLSKKADEELNEIDLEYYGMSDEVYRRMLQYILANKGHFIRKD